MGGLVADADPVSAIAAALEPSGLVPRGWFVTEPGLAPLLSDGASARAICLVGHFGGGFWPVFKAWWQNHPGLSEPLDSWSRAVIDPVTATLGCEAVYPSDRPWYPFQQWAMAAEGLKASPLGMLVHPEFGLWHGYRGAMLMDEFALERLGNRAPSGPPVAMHPCEGCAEKPCLSACPVNAFTGSGFAAADCRRSLASEAGLSTCMDVGCQARDACPVGRKHRFSADQVRFHMAAFGG
ncbi:Ferredoxin [Hoeflea sp. EC-HK425]|nr:Ferredoxin [Hoeflea sp. EC-HK425]